MFRDQTYWAIWSMIEMYYGRGRVIAIYHKRYDEQQLHLDTDEDELNFDAGKGRTNITVLNKCCCNS